MTLVDVIIPIRVYNIYREYQKPVQLFKVLILYTVTGYTHVFVIFTSLKIQENYLQIKKRG